MRRSPIRWLAPRPLRHAVRAVLVSLLVPAVALALGNGKLQIHHVDAGQGDAILLISPQGQTALFDDGTYTDCSGIKNYLLGLGITGVQYHFTTHYHADHIGCIDDLAAIGITITATGYDRGGSYSSATYTAYVNTLGARRQTITKGQTITLDAGAADPVYVKCVDLNGAGVYSGTDENALSTVYKVSYGAFDEALGGDLSGGSGTDVETTVGPEMGDVEVYKVHHHGSATSSNDNWLTAVAAEVGVISVGNGNSYGHPTSSALTRLHNHNVKTYWTETGAGVAPLAGWDRVGGTILVEAMPGPNDTYTVSGTGFTDTYTNGSGGVTPVIVTATVPAASVAMLVGTLTSGSAASLAANDAVRMTVTAARSGSKYATDWYGSAVLAHPPLNLTLTYDGNFSANRTQTLYLYNFGTSAWTQVSQSSVGTADVTRTWTTAAPAAYVSPTGEVRARVLGSLNKSSYSCRGDYLAFTYDYQEGTGVIATATDYAATPLPVAETANAFPAPVERDEIALAAAPNPALGATRLSFTLPRESEVRLEVYDLTGRRVAEPFSGLAPAGTTRVEWSLTDDSGTRLPAGIYFARLQGLGQATVLRVVALGR